MTTRDIDRAVAALATGQHGAFAGRQARAAGATWRQVDSRRRSGLWVPSDGGAFSLAGSPATWEQRLWLALLGFPAGMAFVARRAAAALHSFEGFEPGRVELVVPHGRMQPRAFDLHASRSLDPVDLCLVRGFPATTATRTLLDLAATIIRVERLEQVVDAQLARGLVALPRLARRFAALAVSGRTGFGRMRIVLADRLPGYVPPESELERLWTAVCLAAGLPTGTKQAPLPGGVDGTRTDFLYEDQRHRVEVDGRLWHDRRQQADEDARRDAEALALGYTVQRVRYALLATDPAAAVDALRRRLTLGALG